MGSVEKNEGPEFGGAVFELQTGGELHFYDDFRECLLQTVQCRRAGLGEPRSEQVANR